MRVDDLRDFLTPALLEQLGDAVTVIGPDWRYRYVSARAAEIIGRPVDELVGEDVWSIFPEVLGTPQHEASIRAMTGRTRERIVWYFDAVGRWFDQIAIPAGDGLVVVVNDVTDREVLARRSERLLSIGESLAGATTAAEVNSILADDAFNVLGARGGTILLADEERGVMRAVDLAGIDAGLGPSWEEFPLELVTPGTEAFRTGLPVFVTDIDECREQYPEVADVLVQLGRSTLAATPLTSAGIRIGVLIVILPKGRELDLPDKQFLATTAAMAAQALVRARLLEAERRTMSALQRSLLPPKLPTVGGLRLAARYLASDTAAEIGGDWYDVIPLASGAVGLVMGDVEGHDLGAAALMGLVRSAVRAYALEGHPPAIVLSRANVFLDSLRRGRIVTLSYAQLHPGERLITTVSAGHIAIQVAGPDGVAFEVPSEVGPPLGVAASGQLWQETTSMLPADCMFAMFTDGLIEARDRDIDTGVALVREKLVKLRGLDPEEAAEGFLSLHPAANFDDVALLVGLLTAPAELTRRVTRRLPPTPASVFLARRFTCQLLEAWGVAAETIADVELVLSELVTNAARNSEDEIGVTVSVDDAVVRIEIADSSHRMPTEVPSPDEIDEEATEGRGLVLVAALTARWGVDSEGLSKKVWAEFDLPR